MISETTIVVIGVASVVGVGVLAWIVRYACVRRRYGPRMRSWLNNPEQWTGAQPAELDQIHKRCMRRGSNASATPVAPTSRSVSCRVLERCLASSSPAYRDLPLLMVETEIDEEDESGPEQPGTAMGSVNASDSAVMQEVPAAVTSKWARMASMRETKRRIGSTGKLAVVMYGAARGSTHPRAGGAADESSSMCAYTSERLWSAWRPRFHAGSPWSSWLTSETRAVRIVTTDHRAADGAWPGLVMWTIPVGSVAMWVDLNCVLMCNPCATGLLLVRMVRVSVSGDIPVPGDSAAILNSPQSPAEITEDGDSHHNTAENLVLVQEWYAASSGDRWWEAAPVGEFDDDGIQLTVRPTATRRLWSVRHAQSKGVVAYTGNSWLSPDGSTLFFGARWASPDTMQTCATQASHLARPIVVCSTLVCRDNVDRGRTTATCAPDATLTIHHVTARIDSDDDSDEDEDDATTTVTGRAIPVRIIDAGSRAAPFAFLVYHSERPSRFGLLPITNPDKPWECTPAAASSSVWWLDTNESICRAARVLATKPIAEAVIVGDRRAMAVHSEPTIVDVFDFATRRHTVVAIDGTDATHIDCTDGILVVMRNGRRSGLTPPRVTFYDTATGNIILTDPTSMADHLDRKRVVNVVALSVPSDFAAHEMFPSATTV